MEQQKRTWAEIDLDSIEYNYRTLRNLLPQGCRFLGVVKADAYGHGAVPVAKCLEAAGADYLAVACLDEAEELRRGGAALPILILGQTPAEYVPELLKYNVTQSLGCEADAAAYSRAAASCGGTLKVHVKLDTGMSRLGFLCEDGAFGGSLEAILRSCSLPNLAAEGIFTHFAVSDEPGEDCRDYTLVQYGRFMKMIGALEARGTSFAIRHCANSGAVLNYTKETALDMVRPGILLYGYGDGGRLGLRPCMRLMTRVCAVKEYPAGTAVSYGRTFTAQRPTRMGVLPAGYADGLFRALSNKCAFAAGGGFAPQRGRICMDLCMADLTDLPDVGVGSKVEIFGGKSSLDKLALAAGTIPYELLCAVSKRVPRVYCRGGVPISVSDASR